MEPLSFASFTLAAVLASLPSNGGEPVSQSVITTHISPAIAGQWEIDLDSTAAMSKAVALSSDNSAASAEPKVLGEASGGVLEQSERRTFKVAPSASSNTASNTSSNTAVKTNVDAKKPAQCRELYNFGADNEMWAVSGKEWTYGRYLVTHREEGLPIIAIKTVYDNNEMDCSGNQVDQTNEALIAFLDHDGNQMQWCADPDGKECFMKFRRVLP